MTKKMRRKAGRKSRGVLVFNMLIDFSQTVLEPPDQRYDYEVMTKDELVFENARLQSLVQELQGKLQWQTQQTNEIMHSWRLACEERRWLIAFTCGQEAVK